MQRAYVVTPTIQIQIELPAEQEEILPGICWGPVDAFPTPAYWAYQVYARRLTDKSIHYKLGATLCEEVGACLLGGHGIPAAVGLAAFEHLKSKGAFEGEIHEEETLLNWLKEPIRVGKDREVNYRFAKQKAKYLRAALLKLSSDKAPEDSGRSLRNWLLDIHGVGYKTASWIARNWMNADDVAILDIHILRAGVLAGVLDSSLTVERHYLDIEDQFLMFSKALGVRASELDAVIWYEMAQSQITVRKLLQQLPNECSRNKYLTLTRSSAQDRHPNSHQPSLFT